MNDDYSRGLIISGLSIHLIFAIQLKKTMYPDKPMDLVIATATQHIYINKEAAEKIFDNVYFCDMTNIAPPNNKTIRALFNPKYALREFYIDDFDPDVYSDIFFWGPTWVYYYLYKYFIQHHKNYSWHLYGEGDSSYYEANPNIRLREYGYPWLKKFYKGIDKYFYKYTVRNFDVIKDIYLWNTKYVMYEPVRDIVEMPIINRDDKEYVAIINDMYGYSGAELSQLKNKVIFLDGAYMGTRDQLYDVNLVDNMLAQMGQAIGKENFVIKPHHGIDEEMYGSVVRENCTIMTQEYKWPWELPIINGDVDNCIICGFFTTAISMMYILGVTDIETYVIRDMVEMLNHIPETRYKENELIDELNESYHFVRNEGEFNEMINRMKAKYENA